MAEVTETRNQSTETRVKGREASIDGVIVKKMKRFSDQRGWLSECFRSDEINKDICPVMSYISLTYPGIVRGPHEHINQADYFCFTGPSNFKLYLWDNRKDSPTYGDKMTILAGEDEPAIVVVPSGVVHAYKNVGQKQGFVLNFPNRLFAGWGKKEIVDEIRHENDSGSPFKIEEE